MCRKTSRTNTGTTLFKDPWDQSPFHIFSENLGDYEWNAKILVVLSFFKRVFLGFLSNLRRCRQPAMATSVNEKTANYFAVCFQIIYMPTYLFLCKTFDFFISLLIYLLAYRYKQMASIKNKFRFKTNNARSICSFC